MNKTKNLQKQLKAFEVKNNSKKINLNKVKGGVTYFGQLLDHTVTW